MAKLPTGDYHFDDSDVEAYCDKLLNYGHEQGFESEEWVVLLYCSTRRLMENFNVDIEEADERAIN